MTTTTHTEFANVRHYKVGNTTAKWLECKAHIDRLYCMVRELHLEMYEQTYADNIEDELYKAYKPFVDYLNSQLVESITNAMSIEYTESVTI